MPGAPTQLCLKLAPDGAERSEAGGGGTARWAEVNPRLPAGQTEPAPGVWGLAHDGGAGVGGGPRVPPAPAWRTHTHPVLPLLHLVLLAPPGLLQERDLGGVLGQLRGLAGRTKLRLPRGLWPEPSCRRTATRFGNWPRGQLSLVPASSPAAAAHCVLEASLGRPRWNHPRSTHRDGLSHRAESPRAGGFSGHGHKGRMTQRVSLCHPQRRPLRASASCNSGSSYQLLLALYLIRRLPLQLLLGPQSGHAVSLQALCLLLCTLPLLLQLQGSLNLVREFWREGTDPGLLDGFGQGPRIPSPEARDGGRGGNHPTDYKALHRGLCFHGHRREKHPGARSCCARRHLHRGQKLLRRVSPSRPGPGSPGKWRNRTACPSFSF